DAPVTRIATGCWLASAGRDVGKRHRIFSSP
ncbi:MAG: hypothetical protein ACJAUC_004941, partial [Planctomycetota bacterium]